MYLGCECAAPPPHGMLGSDAAAMRLGWGGCKRSDQHKRREAQANSGSRSGGVSLRSV